MRPRPGLGWIGGEGRGDSGSSTPAPSPQVSPGATWGKGEVVGSLYRGGQVGGRA